VWERRIEGKEEQVETTPDELTLHFIASGLTRLVQDLNEGKPYSLPYPFALQRGLDRLVVACLRQSKTPPQGIPDLIEWCRSPLASWPLAMPDEAIGAKDSLLIGDFPTSICDDWTYDKQDVEAELTQANIMRSALNACAEADSSDAYRAFRALLIRQPVLTAFELQQHLMRPELDILREHVKAAYAPAPLAAVVDGHYHCCGTCHNLLLQTTSGQLECEDERCRSKPTAGRTIPYREEVVWLRRGLRRFIAAPGRAELQLSEKLEELGLQVELWPGLDSYDLRVTFADAEVWAVDVKDWANPFLLGRKVEPLPKEPPWNRAFFVVPDERLQQRADYIRAFQNACPNRGNLFQIASVSNFLRKVRKHMRGTSDA
jgi:hypothetical protein